MLRQKPFLKWAGNKFRCIGEIQSSLPKAKRCIEPFSGSAAVFLNSHYEHYLLAELNPDLIAVYQHLQNSGQDFIAYCKTFFSGEHNNAEHYYAFRKTFNALPEGIERAAHFVYLNRHGYNGLCRYNKKNIFNVPFGRYRKPYFPEQEMQIFHQKSQHATFIVADFEHTFSQAQAGDLIYCDPPYIPLSKSASFQSYFGNGFTLDDQKRLANCAEAARARGCRVLISNHDLEITRDFYKNAHIKSFEVKRSISCHGQTRRPVRELLAIFEP